MNGRLYDPTVGRMLSPDNYVQDALYAQTFNRYSYAHNNPLKYVDPDGNNPLIIVGAVIGGLVNLGMGILNGEVHDGWDALAYFGSGAVIGLLAGATGGAVTTALGVKSVVLSGAISGAISGALEGGAQTAFNMIYQAVRYHVPMKDFLQEVGKSAAWGAAIGGVTGTIEGAIKARKASKAPSDVVDEEINVKKGGTIEIIEWEKLSMDQVELSDGTIQTDGTFGGGVVEQLPPEKHVALGVREHLKDFTGRVNGTTWKEWGGTDFQNQFLQVINDPANTIHFNLDGVGDPWSAISDGAKGFHVSKHITSWELSQIYANPSALQRTIFYLNGSVVPNPFH